MGDLVRRLYQDYEEGDPEYYPGINIAAGPFGAAMVRILDGTHTTTQIKTFYDMDVDEQAEFDLFVAAVQSEPDLAGRLLKIMSLRSILEIKEVAEDMNASGYNSLQDIRTWFQALIA